MLSSEYDEIELEELARLIGSQLSRDTPWHVTRFFPHLMFSHIEPTPIKKLEAVRANDIIVSNIFRGGESLLSHFWMDMVYTIPRSDLP